MKTYKTLTAACLIALTATAAQADTLILSEDFGGDGLATLIGTAEDTSGSLWEGNTAFTNDGGVGVFRGPALLPFSPTNGNIYTATGVMDIQGTDIITFGFAEVIDNIRFHNQAGLTGWAFMFTSPSGQDASEGPRNLGDGNVTVGDFEFASTGVVTLDIVLDTTGATWTASYYVNGNVFTENMELTGLGEGSINYVGFAAAAVSDANTSLNSFSLSVADVPEPSSMALIGLGGMLVLRRRRSC